MHPDHVARHVAASVADMRMQIEARPELAVIRIDLAEPVDLFVHFDKKVWRTAPHRERHVDPYTKQVAIRESRFLDLTPPTTVERVLLFNLDGYDAQPPTAELLDENREPLPAHAWPREFGPQGIVRDHPDYHRPFFCRRGLREYHSHFQHEDDPWDCHREGLALSTVVIELLHDLRSRWVS